MYFFFKFVVREWDDWIDDFGDWIVLSVESLGFYCGNGVVEVIWGKKLLEIRKLGIKEVILDGLFIWIIIFKFMVEFEE